MDRVKLAFVVLFQVVNLGVTVVAGGDAIIGPGALDLFKFQFSVSAPGFGKSGLQESTAATAAEVVGPIRRHVDKIFFSDTGLHHEPQIFGDRVA